MIFRTAAHGSECVVRINVFHLKDSFPFFPLAHQKMDDVMRRREDMPSGSGLQEPILVPLFASALVIETDVVQTAADRFHRWLMHLLDVIGDYRVSERQLWHEDLQALLSRPEDIVLQQQVSRTGTWSLLLHKLDLIECAFTRMLFVDQASAVTRF